LFVEVDLLTLFICKIDTSVHCRMLLKMTNLLSSTAPSPHIHGSSANVHHHFVRKNSTTAFVGRVLFATNLNAVYIYKRQWMLWKVHDVDKSRNNVLQTK